MNIRIETDLANITKVWIDGGEAANVRSVLFEHRAGFAPRFKLVRVRLNEKGEPIDEQSPLLMDVLEQSEDTELQKK